MTDLFTNLAAQTLGTALLIEPLVPAQLAVAPFASEPALAAADHASVFEHEAQPDSGQPLSPLPQPAPQSQPDRTIAPRKVIPPALQPGQPVDLPSLAQPELAEHQTNRVMADDVYARSPSLKHREAALASHQIDVNVSHQPESREVSKVSSQRVSVPASEHVTGRRSSSTTQPAPDKPQQVRSSDRQARSAHEPPTRLVPLQRPNDVMRQISTGDSSKERLEQARSNANAAEARVASAQIDDRAISFPAREDPTGARVSIGTPTSAETSAGNTAVRSHIDRAQRFPIDHEDQIITQQNPALFSLMIQPEQPRRANALVQPRVEALPESLRLSASPARQLTGDDSIRPTIRVSIGRVEVRGSQSTASMPMRLRSLSSRPRLSLNDYLQQRRGMR